jgi:hypothetical protein
VRLLEFLFWFAMLLVVGCSHAPAKRPVPDLEALLDPRAYCEKRCSDKGMVALGNVVRHEEEVFCVCLEDPRK